MPKTKKKFDWEITDENGEFIDVISMTNDEAKEYQKHFPDYDVSKIDYTEND